MYTGGHQTLHVYQGTGDKIENHFPYHFSSHLWFLVKQFHWSEMIDMSIDQCKTWESEKDVHATALELIFPNFWKKY